MKERNWNKSGGGGVCTEEKEYTHKIGDGKRGDLWIRMDHSAKEALGRECPLDSTLTH